jgi:predicted amidohydrolase
VLCNRVGDERDLDFFGGSSIVDARGTVLAATEADGELELTADIPDETGVHETLTYLDDRRIDLRPN